MKSKHTKPLTTKLICIQTRADGSKREARLTRKALKRYNSEQGTAELDNTWWSKWKKVEAPDAEKAWQKAGRWFHEGLYEVMDARKRAFMAGFKARGGIEAKQSIERAVELEGGK